MDRIFPKMSNFFLPPFMFSFCVLVFFFSQHLRNQIGAQGAMELLIFWGEKACEAQNFDMSPHDAVMDAAKAAYHGDADPELVLRSLGEADGPYQQNPNRPQFGFSGVSMVEERP